MFTLKQALGLEGKGTPFPWQEELAVRFASGIGSQLSLDIPTGLGKTSVMAVWLLALAQGASVPRRLVYIVDRRAVVDQATREAERLREWVENQPGIKRRLGLAESEKLPISTLRGHFADNREWLNDPTVPAIIVGTVDMVGSRLLFEGYRVTRKMRPYHAGFLGADVLFVLDEAHLVPPFEKLLELVTAENNDLRGAPGINEIVPRTALLTLSATGSGGAGEILAIGDRDFQHHVANQRLRATKRLQLIEHENDDNDLVMRLAKEAWALSSNGTIACRILVFCDSRKVAMRAMQEVEKLARGDKKQNIAKQEIATQLFVGARRVRERQWVAQWLEKHGFLAGTNPPDKPAFIFCTSAGEVGVDMDADHMVCDLVPFERMVQRCGRVNRRGEGSSEIRVLLERDSPDKKEREAVDKALEKTERQRSATQHALIRQFKLAPVYRAVLEALPLVGESLIYDASPEALRELKINSVEDECLADLLAAATTPPPLRPQLTRPVLDSWSMTSLIKNPARPFVAPWLRGWVEDKPQTTVVWRKYLPTQSYDCTDKQIQGFFEAAPIHLTEQIEATSDDVLKWLLKRAERMVGAGLKQEQRGFESLAGFPGDPGAVGIIIDHDGSVVRKLRLAELQFKGEKGAQKEKNRLASELWHRTLIVDERLGGLSNGLLDEKTPLIGSMLAADGMLPGQWMPLGTTSQTGAETIPPFRILHQTAGEIDERVQQTPSEPQWTTSYLLPIQAANEEEPSQFLTIQKFKMSVTSEDSRSVRGERHLEDHLADAEREAVRIGEKLTLPSELRLVLRIAARNHDHGKDCNCWQNAFSAPLAGRPYAKTRGPVRSRYLGGYRHEFGSLPIVMRDPAFEKLSNEMQDLVLHLVAAHHGAARPNIHIGGCANAPPSVLRERACDTALRFARLQRKWGPWGLAWLESLLRAADQRASAMIDGLNDAAIKKRKTQEVVHG
jgi:CRISPR-associated endonuclease/helicase Cas3